MSSESSSHDAPARVTRLGEAMHAYLGYQGRVAAGTAETREQFLERHAALRALLEPMFYDVSHATPTPVYEPFATDSSAPAPDRSEVAALVDGLRQGRIVGDYRIVRELGRGGMGVVFEAEQVSLRRRVALKVLHPHLAWSARSIERFRREAAIASGLQHPAIVPIHEVGEWSGLHYFSMEFVDGQSLQQLGHRERLGVRDDCSRVAEIAELIARVADALQFAHERGLVHRDVKPHNIMVGKGGVVRLLDFGLVKDVAASSNSVSGAFLGTPHYCSPEQVRGGRELGPRSDVFSLAIVMYELLARRRPFEGDTTRVLLQRIEAGEHEPLRRVAPSTPRDLETICHKGLEVDPAQRYQTAGALAEDLGRFLRIEPILARPPGHAVRLGKWIRRHRVRVALWIAASVVAIGTPLGVALHEADAARSLEVQRRELEDTEVLSFEFLEQTLAMVQEQLESLPSVSGQQHERVDRVVRLCEQFLELRGAEPTRRVRAATAFYLVSYIYIQLGRIDAAAAAVDRAVDLIESSLERLRWMDPHQLAEIRRLEGKLLRRRLYLRQLSGSLDPEQEFEQAMRHWQELASTSDVATDVAVEYCETLLVRARALADTLRGRLEAERLTRRALSVLTPERCLADRRAELLMQRARTLLGVVLLWTGRPTEAVEQLQPTVARLEQLADQPMFGVERTLALSSLGEAKQRLGEVGAAEEAMRKAIVEGDALVARHPGARALRRALLSTRVKLSVLMVAVGRVADAEALLREAPPLPPMPARAADGSWIEPALRAQFDMQLATCILYRAEDEQGREEARELLHSACSTLERLAEQQPDRVRFRSELGASFSNLAALANANREHRRAIDFARRAIAQQERAIEDEPSNGKARTFLQVHRGQLAFALAGLGDLERTAPAIEDVLDGEPPTIGALRLVAESACRCAGRLADGDEERLRDADGVPLSSIVSGEASGVRVERFELLAVEALEKMWLANPKVAGRWIVDARFSRLRGRDDYERLVEEVGR